MENIGHIIQHYLPYSQTFIYSQLMHIKNFRSFIFTTKIIEGDKFPFPAKQIYSLGKSGFSAFRQFLFLALHRANYFERAMRENNIKIVHAHFGPMGICILPLAKKLGLPLITTFYGSDMSMLLKYSSYRRGLRLLFKEGDIFIAISRQMGQRMIKIGCPQEKLRCWNLGVDLEKIKFPLGIPERKEGNLIICARLEEIKGVPYAIRAFARSAEVHKGLFLHIIGDGSARNKLEKLARDLNLQQRAKFWGALSYEETLKRMAGADILLVPSISLSIPGFSAWKAQEPIPMVLQEAQAFGIAVIASRHGGIPELISDGENGMLVEERDVNALSAKINYLWEHPEVRRSMAEKGRKKIEEGFDISKQAAKLENIYREIGTTASF